jgi:malonate decarboxylase epsilon subunit
MGLAFLFPGQGAQAPGMLHELPVHPKVSETLGEASEILGCEVLEFDGEEALSSTVLVQLSLLISGVAVSRTLRAEEIRPDFVIGLSVGAFTAAVSAGALDFKDALSLVKLRAELAAKAYPKGYGLAAVVGLNERQVSKIIEQINRPESPVFLANINAPTQMVISGSDAGKAAVLERARNEGARTTKRLQVSVPSHCVLLQEVADELTRRISTIEIRTPEAIYISNNRARSLRDPDGIREDLATNIAHTVRWHDGVSIASERGARLFLESPPGHILTDLAADAFPDCSAIALSRMPIGEAVEVIRHREPVL